MDQEQPTFKVTDRRLFNADGSPREVTPDEMPEPQTVVAETQATPTASDTQPVAEPAAPPPSVEVEEVSEELTDEELADARDPASFVNFMMSIASNAASALGMMEHPVTHQREVDLELAKHWIDVLGMLEAKTKGNLTSQEKQIMEGLLGDLRMQYVSLTNPQVRKFSGSDITGGR